MFIVYLEALSIEQEKRKAGSEMLAFLISVSRIRKAVLGSS